MVFLFSFLLIIRISTALLLSVDMKRLSEARLQYVEELRRLRDAGTHIFVGIDESYVHQHHQQEKTWVFGSDDPFWTTAELPGARHKGERVEREQKGEELLCVSL